MSKFENSHKLTAQLDSCAKIALVNLIYVLSNTFIDLTYPNCPSNGQLLGCRHCVFMIKNDGGKYDR